MPNKTPSPPVFDEKRNRWKATIPASLTPNGKRLRSWHLTREAARVFQESVTRGKAPAAMIPPILAMEADKARGILGPWKLDLVQAAREVTAAMEILGNSGSLLDAAKAYREKHEARISSKPFKEAVALYLDSKTDLRDATLASYRYTLERVLAPVGLKNLSDIQTADLEAILASKGQTARAMHKRNLKVFWKWAGDPPRRWAAMDTVDDLEAIRLSKDTDIKILTPSEVKALLEAAELESPAAAASYAIAIFGGVRMAELGKLTWRNVGADYIEIGKSIAKKHSRRLIPICPSLRAWMDATRGESAGTSSIVPPNWADVSKSVRRRAGWNVAARLLKNPLPPTRGAWPANACRHTCASVQVAIGTPLDDLVFKFGHSGGHDLLRAHYVSRLPRKDALSILACGPNGTKISNLSAA
jgi:integrase